MSEGHPMISLKAARVNAEMTQNEVAVMMKRTKQTIVNWESGITNIKYTDLVELSKLYSMPIEYLRIPKAHDKR